LPVPRDVSSLAVLGGLAVIWVIFHALNRNFLSPRNLSNLILQIAVLGTIAVGMVIVLILGEIDLSVGAIAGVSAAVLAVMLTNPGVPTWLALLTVLAIGAGIGVIQSIGITQLGIPSFIITLAGLLVWQGVQLIVIGSNGQVPIHDPFVRGIASTYVPAPVGWALAIIGCLVVAGFRLSARNRRVKAGLPAGSLSAEVIGLVIIAVLVLGVTWMLNLYLGAPWVLIVLLALVIIMSVVMSQTPFGRHVYAIGGNREAARRAGIRVKGTTICVFMIISVIAALAGVIEASREFSASSALGGGTLQLNAIAAAVIGGTSLFGGRGKPYHAVLGALVVGSVQNGLNLLGEPAAIQNIATGLILVIAVAIDSISRKRLAARGVAI